jgi:hypothetical protein
MKRKRTPSPHREGEKRTSVTSPMARRSTRAHNPDSPAGTVKVKLIFVQQEWVPIISTVFEVNKVI